MPHIVVKLLAGRSEEQKTRLAAQMVSDVMTIVNCGVRFGGRQIQL